MQRYPSGKGVYLYQVPLTAIPIEAYALLDEEELSALAGSVLNAGESRLPLQIADTLISRQPDHAVFYSLKAIYSVYAKEYAMGISASEKALSLAPDSIKVYSSLALAYLLSDQYEEAKQIYEKWMDSTVSVEVKSGFGRRGFEQRLLKETFLEDLDRLEKFSISHPDVEKIRALLNEEE